MTENVVWLDQAAGILAVLVFVGGLFMMFTNLWTGK